MKDIIICVDLHFEMIDYFILMQFTENHKFTTNLPSIY